MSKLIITGSKSDFLIHDGQNVIYKAPQSEELTDNHEIINRAKHRPFGVGFDDDYIYIASHSIIGRFNKSTYEYIDNINVPLRVNTHEILKHQNKIIVANTGTDTIGIYDLVTKENKFFSVVSKSWCDSLPTPKKDVYEFDKHHVNTITMHNGSLYYCLHNLGKISEIKKLDINSGEVFDVFFGGTYCHGILFDKNWMYTISTGTHELIRFDIHKNVVEYIPIPIKNLFFRGIAIFKNLIYLGGSINTKYGENTEAKLLTFNPTNKEFNVIPFPESKVINSIRVID